MPRLKNGTKIYSHKDTQSLIVTVHKDATSYPYQVGYLHSNEAAYLDKKGVKALIKLLKEAIK